MSAARLGAIRRWPYSWSDSAIDEHAMPVNTAAKIATLVNSPVPCTAVGGMQRSATTSICAVVNGIVWRRFAYAPWYTIQTAKSTAHASVQSSPVPKERSAPVMRKRPTVAMAIPPTTHGDGNRRVTIASTNGVKHTYRPVMKAEVEGDASCSPIVCVA